MSQGDEPRPEAHKNTNHVSAAQSYAAIIHYVLLADLYLLEVLHEKEKLGGGEWRLQHPVYIQRHRRESAELVGRGGLRAGSDFLPASPHAMLKFCK